MKFILTFFIFTAVSAKAESCIDQVKKKITQDVTADPALGYKQEAMVRACEVNFAKAILLSEDFRTLCPGVQTLYRQRCLREWINNYKISVATEPALLMSLIPLAGTEDHKIPHIHNQVLLVQLIDAALAVFERVEFTNFYVNRMTSDNPSLQSEIQGLQKQEALALTASRDRLLLSLEPKVKSIKERVSREPAYDNPTRSWVRTMSSKFESRMLNIKNKKW